MRQTPKTAMIQLPGDKSLSQRALILGALAEGQTVIDNFLVSEDACHTLDALRACGVPIRRQGTRVTVQGGQLAAPKSPLYLGNSGTGARLLTGVLAAQPFDSVLTGDASLTARPMNRIIAPLKQMGACIESLQGHLPLHIRGQPLHRTTYTLPMPSAQVKSALLLAAVASQQHITLHSAPSRDHTERLLRDMGADLQVQGQAIHYTPSKLQARHWQIPGDISSAAFLIALTAAIPGRQLSVHNVGLNPRRIGLLHMLKAMGADVHWRIKQDKPEPTGTVVVQGRQLQGIVVHADKVVDAIDELPVFAMVAALATGRTIVEGAGELKVKESNRIVAIVDGLLALGIEAGQTPEGFWVQGGRPQAGHVSTHADHRIALCFLSLGYALGVPITVDDMTCIRTSWPNFVTMARSIGWATPEEA